MSTVEQLDGSVVRPDDLDPVALLEQHLATGWEYQATVVIDAPARRAIRRLPGALGTVQAIDDEHCRLVGSTSNPTWYVGQLSQLAVPYRILAGPELREAAATIGRRLLAAADQPVS